MFSRKVPMMTVAGIDLSANEFWALPLAERAASFALLRAQPGPGCANDTTGSAKNSGPGRARSSANEAARSESGRPQNSLADRSIPATVMIRHLPRELCPYSITAGG